MPAAFAERPGAKGLERTMSGVTQLQQISEQVVVRFGAAHRTLGTAESLTGGMIASSVADVSGPKTKSRNSRLC